MKNPTIFLVAIIVFSFSLNIIGQEPPKAVLIDEHGQLPCDDSLARMDNWYTELTNNPNSLGLAVISSSSEEKHRSVFRQQMMEAFS